MSLPKKPSRKPEDFIMEAKVESIYKEEQDLKKTKKFLIEMDYDLWFNLKMMALKENKPLKDLIIDILRKSISEE